MRTALNAVVLAVCANAVVALILLLPDPWRIGLLAVAVSAPFSSVGRRRSVSALVHSGTTVGGVWLYEGLVTFYLALRRLTVRARLSLGLRYTERYLARRFFGALLAIFWLWMMLAPMGAVPTILLAAMADGNPDSVRQFAYAVGREHIASSSDVYNLLETWERVGWMAAFVGVFDFAGSFGVAAVLRGWRRVVVVIATVALFGALGVAAGAAKDLIYGMRFWTVLVASLPSLAIFVVGAFQAPLLLALLGLRAARRTTFALLH